MTRCPNGHYTSAFDYCDVCGAPLDAVADSGDGGPTATPTGATAASGPGGGTNLEPCPSCGTPHAPDALFCESCGYDFTTGTMPRPLDPPDRAPAALVPPASAQPDATTATATAEAVPLAPPDVAEESGLPDVPVAPPVARWVVEVWTDPDWYTESQSPDPMPAAGPPRTVVLTGRSALVGRPSASRNIHPDVDCSDDSGVSRRHAQLTADGTRFWVEDLESANGTFVGEASGGLPKDPVAVGPKHELGPDDRVYVGAWTRLVVRPATEDELG